MTTLELAKIVRDNGCEIRISPCIGNAIYIDVRNSEKAVRYGVELVYGLTDPEKTIDYTIDKCVYQIKDG